MTRRKTLPAVLAVLLLGLAGASPALAVPPLPSGFYGTVSINSANAPAGATVSARIDGTQYAYSTVLFHQGQTVYGLDVPGDDPATPGVVEGGVPGDKVVFWIGGTPANEAAAWQGGTNVARNLSATQGRKVFLPLTRSSYED
jgi:hypothetical protein